MRNLDQKLIDKIECLTSMEKFQIINNVFKIRVYSGYINFKNDDDAGLERFINYTKNIVPSEIETAVDNMLF